jgi:hypothetical protein
MSFWVSGLVPICEAITLATQPAVMRLPMPTPGLAVSLAMMVKLRAPREAKAARTRCGEPTPMKPPIITTAPSGISSAAAAGESAVLT